VGMLVDIKSLSGDDNITAKFLSCTGEIPGSDFENFTRNFHRTYWFHRLCRQMQLEGGPSNRQGRFPTQSLQVLINYRFRVSVDIAFRLHNMRL
jgi:hypothetical protein